MDVQQLIDELDTISLNLYRVRLPVSEANAYMNVLKNANKLSDIALRLKEEADNADSNKQE